MNENSSYEKELRIGLILYGGVSLAIYIYGVVYEFLRLVRQEDAYGELTKAVGVKPTIDVISGSSAGGINGLFLAKALASGADLSPLRELWIQQGDLETLINTGSETPLSLLDSQYYETQLREALEKVQVHTTQAAKSDSNLLDLFITATNLDGIVTEYGQPYFHSPIQTKHYGTVFHFKTRPGIYGLRDHLQMSDEQPMSHEAKQNLAKMIDVLRTNREALNDLDTTKNRVDQITGRNKNYYLARLAASTSAFPIAFAPVAFKKEDLMSMKRLFSTNVLDSGISNLAVHEKESAQNVVYGDGGMVNNKPFSHAIRTIFRRQADGPVDRKLFFIEPDPIAFNQSNRLGDRETVDGFDSLKSFLEANFYESISTDLEALVEQNRRIQGVREILLDFEEELARYLKIYHDSNASVTAEENRKMYQRQPVYNTYQQIKITSLHRELEEKFLEKANLDQLLFVLEQSPPAGFIEKNRADREIFVQNRLKSLIDNLTREQYHSLQTDEDISVFLRRFDYHFRIRRLRYFINKLNVWLTEIDVMPGIDKDSELVTKLIQRLSDLKGKFYTFVEYYDHGAWQIWNQAPLISTEEDLPVVVEAISNGFDKLMDNAFKRLTFEVIGDELAQAAKQIQELRPIQPYMPGSDAYYDLQRTTVYLENMLAQCTENDSVNCLEQVFNAYEFLDMYLYPATILANIGEADPIEVIRVSPKDATRYRDSVETKLAGEKLMHFSGFLKRSWRENDLLWGRLDAAEIIVKAILPDEVEAKKVLDKLCPAIIEEELAAIRERRKAEITQSLFNDNEQTQLKQILDEHTAAKEIGAVENFLQAYFTSGQQGLDSVGQNYALRTSAKILRTTSRMFERQATQNKRNSSALTKPFQYLTILLNLPYIFLVTLGGAEESQRKRFINLAVIVATLLIFLHVLGGLVLESWLLLGVIAFLLYYLRPSRAIGLILFVLALLALLFTVGIVKIDIAFQLPWGRL